MAGSGTLRISLLHATYRRTGGPLPIRDAWLDAAVHPERVEYVVAGDDNDPAFLAARTEQPGLLAVVNPPDATWSTAVRNWNAAAAVATGDLLMVIADDLLPPARWDEVVESFVSTLDPLRTPFAINLSDGALVEAVLLRHPVLSRAFYSAYGLFDPRFHGMYCDADFTWRAFWKALIVDGSSLVLDHRHPMVDGETERTESFTRGNRPSEYEHGEALFESNWPRWKRMARPQSVPVHRLGDFERAARSLRRRTPLRYAGNEVRLAARQGVRRARKALRPAKRLARRVRGALHRTP